MVSSLLAAKAAVYVPLQGRVRGLEDLSHSERLFTILLPGEAELGARPGQFVQVSLPGFAEAPISVATSSTRPGAFQLAVRRAGALTAAMHALLPGDEIGIRGPFGNWFDLEIMEGNDLLLIAGGCGLAPMRSLIQYCEDRPSRFGRVTLLYGAKSPQDLLFKSDLDQWWRSAIFDCRVTVDNVPEGTCHDGHVGLITQLIPPLDLDPSRTIAVIVGPPVMYRFVIEELRNKGLTDGRICVSLERYMRCGMGKCGHCTIEHLYCCIDGPVFWLDKIRGIRGAI